MLIIVCRKLQEFEIILGFILFNSHNASNHMNVELTTIVLMVIICIRQYYYIFSPLYLSVAQLRGGQMTFLNHGKVRFFAFVSSNLVTQNFWLRACLKPSLFSANLNNKTFFLLRFGQNCSFAHGIGELRQKTGYHHLMNSIYPISPLSPYASDQFGLGYGCNQYHSVNGIGSEG